ncbi:autotransporter outer membrane beta-barrel domain-containing protein [Escherichia coli]
MDDGKSREFQPFVEVNWLHNSKDFSTSMDGVSVTQDGARNIAEIKLGGRTAKCQPECLGECGRSGCR